MNPELFLINPSYFDHSSWLHGVGHTGRVMALVLELGKISGLERECQTAFCAAYIHDLARLHDGVCTEHGPRSALLKFPLFVDFFTEQGFSAMELEAVKASVHWHSLKEEPDTHHEHYRVIALLKDADALDRIRLGPFDLNSDYLRFPESRTLIRPAQKLFLKTHRCQHESATYYMEHLRKILQRHSNGLR